jgi:hypothetical protein
MAWFGPEEGIGDSLRFPVFMSSLTPDAVKALKATHRKLPKGSRHSSACRTLAAGRGHRGLRYDSRVVIAPAD